MSRLADSWEGYWRKRGARAAAWPWIPFVAACVPAKARVLDVGCGDGQLLERLRGRDAEGVDVLPAAARFCRERGLKVRCGDFLKMRFAKRYDVVVLSEVLMFAEEPERMLQKARELLAPGGTVVVTAGNAGHPWSLAAKALGRLPEARETPYRRYTERGLRALAERGGFRVARWNSFSWWPRRGPRRVRVAHALRARHFVAVLEPAW